MPAIFTNRGTSTLASPIDDDDTAITVLTGEGALFPAPDSGDAEYSPLVIEFGGNYEIVYLTARTGDALTVSRGEEGTTPLSWVAGARISNRVTAGPLNALSAGGDMLKAVYDPTAVEDDAFDMDNMAEGADAKILTAAERAKIGHLTVTQSVDLDAIETRVNALDAAVWLAGTWDASSGSFPGGGTAQAGAAYIVSVGGTVDGRAFSVGDRVLAIVDNASTSTYAANWLHEDFTDLVTSVVGETGVVTISHILTALLTVDGSGSGLDADKLRNTTPSANALSFLAAADYAAMRVALDVLAIADALSRDGTETVKNKSLRDATTRFRNESDTSKVGMFLLSGVTTGQTRTLTWPDADGTIARTSQLPANASTSVVGLIEHATAAEYRANTSGNLALTPAEVWTAAAVAPLTDGATIAVDLAAGFNFGGASNAVLGLGGNRELGAPSNVKSGQTGVLWFGAVTSTRTLTLNAAWLMMDGVAVGPYSITTAQILGVAYVTRGTSVFVTAILRRAA